MPDIKVSEWTLRALQIPRAAVKPTADPLSFTVNVSNGHLKAMAAYAEESGADYDSAFFASMAGQMHVHPALSATQ